MKKFIVNSEKETFEFAKNIGKKTKAGAVFALKGDLGAGKTVFAKGLARGLGVKKTVTSPTFVLMKIYPVLGNKSVKEFCHIDAYRLKSGKDLLAIGADEYLKKKNAVTAVEWPEKIKKFLPLGAKLVKLKHEREERREIEIK